MKKLLAAVCFAALWFAAPAQAQSTGTVVVDCTVGVGLAYTPGATRPMTLLPTGSACVNASVSASITGFPTTQSTGTPIAVTTGGVTGTLPSGTVVVASNVGATNGAYCKLGASATTSDQLIPPNSWFSFTVGASTQLTCTTSTSTTTVNMVGGSGLPTGSGGGGGGGSGGSVTQGTTPWLVDCNSAANTLCGLINSAIPAGTNIIGGVFGSPNVGPTDCSGTITTGGTAQNAIAASATIHGFTIANIDSTTGSGEPLWMSFTTTAAASTVGSYPMAAPTATTFAGYGSYSTPMGFGSSHAVSIIGATTGHKFSCTTW